MLEKVKGDKCPNCSGYSKLLCPTHLYKEQYCLHTCF